MQLQATLFFTLFAPLAAVAYTLPGEPEEPEEPAMPEVPKEPAMPPTTCFQIAMVNCTSPSTQCWDGNACAYHLRLPPTYTYARL
ncbi:hypothetical protein F4780DRAFT_778646 [Xylariomycetidae sp. FL0641]|nr:hypothetical protein F4780DRAFT_778646 [Xylariomycetidae sp. FL0641]